MKIHQEFETRTPGSLALHPRNRIVSTKGQLGSLPLSSAPRFPKRSDNGRACLERPSWPRMRSHILCKVAQDPEDGRAGQERCGRQHQPILCVRGGVCICCCQAEGLEVQSGFWNGSLEPQAALKEFKQRVDRSRFAYVLLCRSKGV